jgi:hypothetical protein
MSVLRRGAIAAAVFAIVLQWVNTRASILHVNQDPAHPVILDTYAFYHLMAMGLRDGRIGQIDLAAVRRYQSLNDRSAPYERLPRNGPHEWVSYYSLDVGYSFIVEAARLAFPMLPDSRCRTGVFRVLPVLAVESVARADRGVPLFVERPVL